MPYANPEKRKEAQKKYRETHKTECRERTKKCYLKRKGYYNEQHALAIRKARKRALEIIGSRCIICNSDKRICFHEIHGTSHSIGNIYVYLNHSQDFVPLCYTHHRIIHELAKLSPEAREQLYKVFDLIE
jgi:hypothetical protein